MTITNDFELQLQALDRRWSAVSGKQCCGFFPDMMPMPAAGHFFFGIMPVLVLSHSYFMSQQPTDSAAGVVVGFWNSHFCQFYGGRAWLPWLAGKQEHVTADHEHEASLTCCDVLIICRPSTSLPFV